MKFMCRASKCWNHHSEWWDPSHYSMSVKPCEEYCNVCPRISLLLVQCTNIEEILKPEVIDLIKKYAAAGDVNINFSNLGNAFLEKHVSGNK